MSGTSMELVGGKELERKLQGLPKKVAKKVVRKSLRKGAKPIQVAAKANAKSDVGGEMGAKIARAIKIRAQKKQTKGSFGINVLILSKNDDDFIHITKSGVRYFIPAAIEYGHAAPGESAAVLSSFGGKRGKRAREIIGGLKTIPANPFMRRAFESHRNRAVQVTMREMWEGIKFAAKESG